MRLESEQTGYLSLNNCENAGDIPIKLSETGTKLQVSHCFSLNAIK